MEAPVAVQPRPVLKECVHDIIQPAIFPEIDMRPETHQQIARDGFRCHDKRAHVLADIVVLMIMRRERSKDILLLLQWPKLRSVHNHMQFMVSLARWMVNVAFNKPASHRLVNLLVQVRVYVNDGDLHDALISLTIQHSSGGLGSGPVLSLGLVVSDLSVSSLICALM